LLYSNMENSCKSNYTGGSIPTCKEVYRKSLGPIDTTAGTSLSARKRPAKKAQNFLIQRKRKIRRSFSVNRTPIRWVLVLNSTLLRSSTLYAAGLLAKTDSTADATKLRRRCIFARFTIVPAGRFPAPPGPLSLYGRVHRGQKLPARPAYRFTLPE